MDAKITTNKNILGLLEYLQRTIEAITMMPRTDGMIAIDLNIYPSVESVFKEWSG